MNHNRNKSCLAYRSYGDENVLEILELPDAAPRAGEYSVRVEAVSVNPVDWKIMSGEQGLITGSRLRSPRIFGSDFAGTIMDAGPGADVSMLGHRVAGMVNPLFKGSACRYLNIKADSFVPIPDSLDTVEAAALPAAGISAWRLWAQRPRSWWENRPVLLYGASGGVGHLVLQLLAASQAKVVAMSREENHPPLLGLGAAACLDYRKWGIQEALDLLPDLTRSPKGLALVDCQGLTVPLVLEKQHGLVKKLAGLGCTWFPLSIANQWIPRVIAAYAYPWFPLPVCITLAIPSKKILTSLMAMAQDGSLSPLVESIHPLDKAGEAIHKSRQGHCLGKIIITME